MKVERQGINECFLATIGALASVPLTEVRAKASKLVFPFPGWATASVVASQDKLVQQFIWHASKKLAENYSLPFALFVPENGSLPIFKEADYSRVELCKAVLPDGLKYWILPRKGRGTIMLHIMPAGVRHIMPWEDGLAYDPNKGTGLPLFESMLQYTRLPNDPRPQSPYIISIKALKEDV